MGREQDREKVKNYPRGYRVAAQLDGRCASLASGVAPRVGRDDAVVKHASRFEIKMYDALSADRESPDRHE